MAQDDMTVGAESLAKAHAALTQPAPSLLAAYERWKAAQAPAPGPRPAPISRDERAEAQAKLARKAAKKLRKARALAAAAGPQAVEQVAELTAKITFERQIAKGAFPGDAQAEAWRRYIASGGRQSWAQYRREHPVS
ncbi:MAG: hypothetical protein M0004_12685 [Actinomycetota bacterium]|nr:hypothetical protein [Actinomycetota bacterium]